MRILLSIHHGLDRDTGAPGVTVDLATLFEEQGHEVSVVSFDDLPGWLPERMKSVVFPAFVAARGRSRYDVLDASSGDAGLAVLLPRRLRPGVVVTRSHGLETLAWQDELLQDREGRQRLSRRRRVYMRGLRLPVVRLSLRRATGVLVLNPAERDHVVAMRRGPERTVLLSPNGIPPALVADPPPERDGAGPAGVAFVGSYIVRKGVQDLAAAMRRVLAERPDARLGLFGTGVAHEDVLRDYPRDLHDRIAVVPRFPRDELPALLRDYAVLAQPSLFEGSSVALLEGMACGLAPVASDTPGATALVAHEENGLVVPARRPQALAAAIARLLDDPPLRERLGRAARATAERHTWPVVVERTLSWYRELAGA